MCVCVCVCMCMQGSPHRRIHTYRHTNSGLHVLMTLAPVCRHKYIHAYTHANSGLHILMTLAAECHDRMSYIHTRIQTQDTLTSLHRRINAVSVRYESMSTEGRSANASPPINPNRALANAPANYASVLSRKTVAQAETGRLYGGLLSTSSQPWGHESGVCVCVSVCVCVCVCGSVSQSVSLR